MSWFELYVKFSELLFWIQDGAASAPAAGPAPAAGAAPAGGAAEAGRVAADAPNPIAQFAPILIIGVFFYFILLRPQQKEQRRRQDFLSNLKKNVKELQKWLNSNYVPNSPTVANRPIETLV